MRAALACLAALLAACCACKAPGGANRTAGQPGIEAMERALPPPTPLAGVREGMTAQQVTELLGPPELVEKKRTDAQTEVWYYDEGAVLMRKGKVALVLPAPSGG